MVDPGKLAHAVERADKGRVVFGLARLPNRRRKAVAPGEGIRVEQRGAPFLEAVEQVEMARKGRAIGDLQPAAPGKYIDFLDLGRLQLQRLRIAAPCGAHRPCFCNRTDDNQVSADKNGYIPIITLNYNIITQNTRKTSVK